MDNGNRSVCNHRMGLHFFSYNNISIEHMLMEPNRIKWSEFIKNSSEWWTGHSISEMIWQIIDWISFKQISLFFIFLWIIFNFIPCIILNSKIFYWLAHFNSIITRKKKYYWENVQSCNLKLIRQKRSSARKKMAWAPCKPLWRQLPGVTSMQLTTWNWFVLFGIIAWSKTH